MLENVGYAHSVAIGKPKEILESEGVQEELISMGFNTDTAKQVVSEILLGGENDTVKLRAADMVFKVHGDYAPEKHINLNIDADLTEREQELRDSLRELLD
jgi:hypothetical protein